MRVIRRYNIVPHVNDFTIEMPPEAETLSVAMVDEDPYLFAVSIEPGQPPVSVRFTQFKIHEEILDTQTGEFVGAYVLNGHARHVFRAWS